MRIQQHEDNLLVCVCVCVCTLRVCVSDRWKEAGPRTHVTGQAGDAPSQTDTTHAAAAAEAPPRGGRRRPQGQWRFTNPSVTNDSATAERPGAAGERNPRNITSAVSDEGELKSSFICFKSCKEAFKV